MNKGVTCHKTENSFVMRFTKEVWLACSASENDIFAKGLQKQDANLKQKSYFVDSKKIRHKKGLKKFKRSWSLNTENIDNHILMSSVTNKESECTNILIDTLSQKVKRHNKSNSTKKSLKPKRTQSCQDYDMSTIEGIFANDSTIEYDSDKTVDFDFGTSERKGGGLTANSFKDTLLTSSNSHPDPHTELQGSSLKNQCNKSNSACETDDALKCYDEGETSAHSPDNPVLNVLEHNAYHALHETNPNLHQPDFMPSISSAFNLSFDHRMSNNSVESNDIGLIDACRDICKSSKISSYNDFSCLSSAVAICEDKGHAKGLSTSNSVDNLDSSSASLSTIDFYTCQAQFSPKEDEIYNSPKMESMEEDNMNKSKCTQACSNTEVGIIVLEPPALLQSKNESHSLYKETSYQSKIVENPSGGKSDKSDCESSEIHSNLLGSALGFSTHPQSDLNKRVCLKKPRGRRKKRKKQSFSKQNQNSRLTNISNPDDIKNVNVSPEKKVIEPMENADTDTDTIPLELECDFVEANSLMIPPGPSSKVPVGSPCDNNSQDDSANSNIVINLERNSDLNASSEDIITTNCCKDIPFPQNINIHSALADLSLGVDSFEEVHFVKEAKLEVACDDSSDDLEIVDLEDIEVDDVLTVNFSESGKLMDDSLQNISCDIIHEDKMDESNFTDPVANDTKPIIKTTEEHNVDVFQDEESGDAKDSQLVIDLSDSIVTQGIAASQEPIKIEAEERDVSLNIKPQVEYLDGLTPCESNDSKELIVLRESPAVRKWERPNIFENLTAKVNLSVNNENISVTSNFVVNSFAQKLVLELLADSDEIKFKTKNSFSIENIKKVIHKKCSKADTAEDLSVVEVSAANISLREHVQSKVVNEFENEKRKEGDSMLFLERGGEGNISFNSNTPSQSPKPAETDKSERALDNVNSYVSTKVSAENSKSNHVDSLESGGQKNIESSARKSIKKLTSRFVKRNHLAKKSDKGSSFLKSKCKRIVKLSSQRSFAEATKTTKQKPKENLGMQEIQSTKNVHSLEDDIYSEVSEGSLNSCYSYSVHNTSLCLENGTSHSALNACKSFTQVNATDSYLGQTIHWKGLGTVVDIKSGAHLTAAFQPHVNIIPLPLESLTRLAMKTKLECDSFRDDMFEGGNEFLACLSAASSCSELEQAPPNLEIIQHTMEDNFKTTEETRSIRPDGKKDSEGTEVLPNVRKRKASFLEALNVLPALQSKSDKRKLRKIHKNDKKPTDAAAESLSGSDRSLRPNSKGFEKSLAEAATPSVKRRISAGSNSMKGRVNNRKSSSNVKKPILLPSKSLSENLISKDNSNSLDPILSLFDKTSVMSLPKIKKLSEANFSGSQSQRNSESYGVLEKIEKAMEDDCLRFNTQSNINKAMFPSMFSSSSIQNFTLTSPKAHEVLPAHQFRSQQTGSIMPSRKTSFHNRNIMQNNSMLAGHLENHTSNDMRVGVDLLWMKNNKSHDPLGLEDDEEENCNSDQSQNQSDISKADSASCSKCRIHFIGSKSAEVHKVKNSESEHVIDESHFLNKIHDESNDLEMIIKVQQRMADHKISEKSYIRNRYGGHHNHGSYNENCRRPYWKRNWNYAMERGSHYKPLYSDSFNGRNCSYGKFQSRGPRSYNFPKAYRDHSTSESSDVGPHFQASSTSGLDVQSFDSEHDVCQSQKVEGDMSSKEDHFRHHAGPHRKYFQHPQWRSSYRNYPWQTSKKCYGHAKYARGHTSQSESAVSSASASNENILPVPTSYHDFSGYNLPKDQGANPGFWHGNVLGTSEVPEDESHRMSQLLPLVKSKVTENLERSLLPAENSHRIVEEIMKKLQQLQKTSKIKEAKADDDNEEGECDDSDTETMDLDYVIEQYFRESRHYYSQHHLRPPRP